MQEIYDTLRNKSIYLLEGACGTGKTLSALAPALAVAKECKKTVVIATNINQQKVQFIDEARKIKKKSNINVAVMASKKEECCHNQGRMNEKDKIDYEKCKQLRDSDKCEQYNNIKEELVKDSFHQWLCGGVRNPEELAKWGKEHKACVYSLLLQSLEYVDLVICDVNIVLNKIFLNIFKFFSKKSLNDLIIIFDEAHNIERVARKVYAKHISERRLEFGRGELEHVLDEIKERKNDLLNDRNLNLTKEDVEEEIRRRYPIGEEQLKSLQSFIECTLVAMRSIKIDETIIKSATDEYKPNIQIADPRKPYYDRKDEFEEQLLKAVGGNENLIRESISKLNALGYWLDKRLSEEDEHELKSSCTIISGFLHEYIEEMPKKNGYYPYMSISKNNYGQILRQLNIHLSLPEIITAPVIMEMYGGILMSATLEPFDVLKQVLGIGREMVERTEGLQFPLKNRRTYVVGRDKELDVGWDRIKYRNVPDRLVSENDTNPVSEKYQQNTVENIIDGSNRSVLIFFKNKQEARKYYNLLKNKYNGRIFLNDSSNNSGIIKDKFYRMGDRGQKPIMCTYIGGSLAEGVDFRDDRARTVVIVGIGYTPKDMLTYADITAYKVKFGEDIGWKYVVQVPTIRKTRQAMGRVIRSGTDYGVRILMDIRYNPRGYLSVHSLFPEVERREFKNIDSKGIKGQLIKDFKELSVS